MKLGILTFSPTGTSSAVAQAIAKGMVCAEQISVDVTHCTSTEQSFGSEDLVIVSVPVYGGHVAPVAAKRLDNVKGNNTPAVAVVVYGNRHYENALQELSEYLTQRGFRVVAAGTFIGEHSYSTEATPIAVGRPHAQDLQQAEAFGANVMTKLSQDWGAPAVDVSTIEMPQQDANVMMEFKQTIMGWMKQGMTMPKAPDVDVNLCIECGTCADVCPASAIPADAPSTTVAEACIKCCACVKACPTGARTLTTPFAGLLTKMFAEQKENKTLL